MALKNNEDTSNIGSRWTIEEDQKLVKEISNNKSYEEIALEHKRTINGVKSRVITHIIYPKYKDDINNIDFVNISKEYNIDNETIIKYINKLKSNEIIQKSINKNKDDNIIQKSINKKNILEYLEKLDNKINEINTKLDMLLNQSI